MKNTKVKNKSASETLKQNMELLISRFYQNTLVERASRIIYELEEDELQDMAEDRLGRSLTRSELHEISGKISLGIYPLIIEAINDVDGF